MSHAKELAFHFVPMAAAGVGAALLALTVAHALLRTFLESRGVHPWTLRDTVGATPVLLLGAWLLGAAAGLLVPAGHGALGAGCAMPQGAILLALALAALGGVALRLGLLALRKLT